MSSSLSSSFVRSQMWAWVLVLLLAGLVRAEPKVTVNKAEPTVKTRYFDPKNKPADMPPMKGDEAALCSYNVGAAASVAYSLREGGSGRVCEAEFTDMTVNLTCDITIWLPNNWTEKLRLHEEGHRQITEQVYATSEKLAESLAKAEMAKKPKLDPRNCQGSADQAANDAAQAVCKQWIDQIAGRAGRVNAVYDDITDHSRKKIDEQTAIKQAFERVRRTEE